MSLSKTITLSVNDYNINLSSNIKFYKNDQLKLIFEINGYGINVMSGVRVKTLMPIAPLNATLFIETPLGVDSIESANIEDNAVTFYLSSAQTQHVGISRMQIQLSDEDGCQVTLPPFEFEIRENIYNGEVVLQEVLLADEDNNVLVDENGNALNTGTQVSSQTYSVALSTDETKTASSIPTKQIQDYNLKISVEGTEDLLIQDNGVTKRIKSSELMNSVDLTGYATESYVQTKIAEASLGGEVDLSSYATKDELATKADKTAIPTKVSQLTNDKGYLTSHQNISGKADKTYVDAELAKKANVSHAHSYNDLTDKPTIPSTTNLATKKELTDGLATKANKSEIPSLEGYATETFVTNKIAEASLGGDGEVDLSGYATKDELNSSLATKSDTTHNHDKVYAPIEHEHSQYLTEHQDLSDYALKTELPTVPTKTSQLTNDSGFIKSIPSEYVTETELDAKGYLTEHQDISGKANISDLSSVATSGNYNDLINTPTIPNEYVLPTASSTTLGGIKVGSGLSIDSNGILSATSSGSGSSTGNGIVFNDSYVADCNTWLSNGYIKTSPNTSNLPTLCTGEDRYGVLFFIAENTTNGTGTQMYFPVDGTYKGRVFTRSLTAMSTNGQASEWVLLTIQSDLEGYATETYVNNKTTPRLVGDSVSNSTLTLTTDKYQYATLSNGNSIVLPTVSSFTEIHLFFKASSDLTLTFPSVRWQSIPSITSGHTYEIVFTYVVDEWLAGIICYQ